MDCRAFEEWLDDGRPRDDAETARAAAEHAASCPACAAAAADADEWEHALEQRFAVAPEGFTDRVMARLPARTETEALSIPEDRESPWPWWLQMLLEPAAALGLLLGVVYAVAAPRLLGTGRELAPSAIDAVSRLVGGIAAPGWLHGPAGSLALIAVAAVVCLGLFRGSIALFDRISGLRPH